MIVLLLVACDGGGGEGDGALLGVAGEVTAQSSGADGASHSGVAETLSAFGVNTAGEVALVLSANANATCDDAVDFLTDGGEDWNPEAITPVGACSVYLRGSYDGTPLDVVDDAATIQVALNCAMDTGEWVYEERGAGDIGWYFDGAWWIGSPQSFSLQLSGGDGEAYSLSLTMDDYTGSFTHDTENPDPDPASGEVTGTTEISWCPEMGPALAR
jgi:hypothetical protein